MSPQRVNVPRKHADFAAITATQRTKVPISEALYGDNMKLRLNKWRKKWVEKAQMARKFAVEKKRLDQTFEKPQEPTHDRYCSLTGFLLATNATSTILSRQKDSPQESETIRQRKASFYY